VRRRGADGDEAWRRGDTCCEVPSEEKGSQGGWRNSVFEKKSFASQQRAGESSRVSPDEEGQSEMREKKTRVEATITQG